MYSYLGSDIGFTGKKKSVIKHNILIKTQYIIVPPKLFDELSGWQANPPMEMGV